MSSTHRTIPALDGLRALSIGFVVLAHASRTHGFPWPDAWIETWISGGFGVRVFFVISGYLITHLLLRESERYGSIDLGRFYLRRSFRIFPAYYALLAVVGLLAAFDVIGLLPGDMIHAVTYTQNYQARSSWWVAHAWSLAVEEQFYLVWPATLLVLGVRRGLWAAALYVLLAPVIRWSLWYHRPDWYFGTPYSFEVVADAIASGCLLAGFRERLWRLRPYRALLSSPLFVLVPVGVWWVSTLPYARFHTWFGITLMNVGLALVVDACLRTPRSLAVRILDSRPLVFVGRRSYSLYLWQQMFLVMHERFPAASAAPWFVVFPWNVGCAFAVACASYAWIEQPCLRLRDRIEASRKARRARPALVAVTKDAEGE